jgi:hypothetical protein
VLLPALAIASVHLCGCVEPPGALRAGRYGRLNLCPDSLGDVLSPAVHAYIGTDHEAATAVAASVLSDRRTWHTVGVVMLRTGRAVAAGASHVGSTISCSLSSLLGGRSAESYGEGWD